MRFSVLDIKEITILPGKDKAGTPEKFESLLLRLGDTVSIVGPTGSGKSTFIGDIEMLADGDTVSGRSVLINGKPCDRDHLSDPSNKPIVLITQHTNFLADMSVEEFLEVHAAARNINKEGVTGETIELANRLTGEKVAPGMRMTKLSGGQTRSVMIADAVIIGNAPIVLLDEVENAGIFKDEVLQIIKMAGKIIVFVTHDPVIALLTDIRIVMKNGTILYVHRAREVEKQARKKVIEHDLMINVLRERIRSGEILNI